MIERRDFGQIAGNPVSLWVLRNQHGCEAHVTNYGATLVQMLVPDRRGVLGDVVLGFDDLRGYTEQNAFIGCIVGRFANRIAQGRFELDGRAWQLPCNDPPHHLHGGPNGWHRAVWQLAEQTENSVTLALTSPDGDSGFPGKVEAQAQFGLDAENQLTIALSARTDTPTLVNMAHHGYWNLAGPTGNTVLDHELRLDSDAYTPGTPMVPDGRVEKVQGTPFDFTRPKAIGRDLELAGGSPVGYDHNFVVRGAPNALRSVAELYEPSSGRVLTLHANQPGVQFYSGNFLDGSLVGKGGVRYPQRSGLCLETQGYPNAINIPAWAPQVVLRPGGLYHHVMVHAFSTR